MTTVFLCASIQRAFVKERIGLFFNDVFQCTIQEVKKFI